MNRTLLTLAALLLSGASLPAQVVPIPTFASAVTTGAVGLGATQTAQLNVVSLQSSSTCSPPQACPTIPTAICQVQLEFWDSTGKMVKSMSIPNLGLGATESLQIKLSEVTTANTSPQRAEIRGVVRRTTPTAQTGVTISPGATVQPIAFYPVYCAVATTLEVFDSTTGATQALTSDLHTLEQYTVLPPLPALGH